MSDRQMRKVQLTINNPIESGFDHLSIINTLNFFNLKYYCMVDEIGESGTYHTHVYMLCQSSIRFSTIKRKFPTAHIEQAYGSSKDNRDYILKKGKWENTKKAETTVENTFYEFGELPSEKQEKHPLMLELRDEIEAGMTTAQIIREHPNLSFRTKDIDTLRQVILSEKYSIECRDITVIYIYGATGTGKTHSIYEQHEATDICRITSYKNNKALFDSYTCQPVLVLEEFRGQIGIDALLNILDKYPTNLPARYSDRIACFEIVYIISNLALESLYTHTQIHEPATWDALMRRINIIRHYTGFGKFEEITLTKQ